MNVIESNAQPEHMDEWGNSYYCDCCNHSWSIEADSQCDDRCEFCDTSVSPHYSHDLEADR